MSSINGWAIRLMLVLLLTTGCGPKSTSSTESSGRGSGEDGEVAAVGADGAKTKKSLIPLKRPETVKSIDGNWVVVLTHQKTDSYRWIVRFTRGSDAKYSVEFLDSSVDKSAGDQAQTEKPEVTETQVDGDAIRFAAKTSQGAFNFVGSFQQGIIRGTIWSSPFEVFLTRLLATDEKSLASFSPTASPPGTDVFAAKAKTKDLQPDDLISTIKEYRTSPLAQEIYSMVMVELAKTKFDEAKFKDLIDSFSSSSKLWGDRWEARANMAIAVNLLKARLYPRLVLEHINLAEKKLGDDLPAFQETLRLYRDAADTNIQIQDLMNDASTEEVRTAAYTALNESLKKQPFNSEVLLCLANEAERKGNVDAAIDFYSDIVALPLLEMQILQQRKGEPPNLPSPSEALKKLWSSKHGSEDGYLKHVDDVYHARIESFIDELRKNGPPPPTEKSGKKTVLVEFFTGMMCPPCVGADMALAALAKTFSTSDVIVLRYHQHIPMPDGLVNQDSEERAAFYQISSAPMIVVDGIMIDPRFYAGPIHMALGGYSVLRKVIDPRLMEKPEITLQLTAEVTDGQLAISAAATGIPDDLLPSCRLRMAIVENLVHTSGPTNGVRDHENVVREMPGRAKGIPPKNGELKYSLTMPVADIQQNVVSYISRFEAGRRGEFPPEMKPDIRGPLSLVAWVQNGNPDATTQAKLVLQSAIVPITGDTGFGSEATATTDAKTSATTSTATDAAVESTVTPPPPALPE